MKSFAQALFFTAATCATLRPKPADDECCFRLTSVGSMNGTVLEDVTGYMVLGGPDQQGEFCLNKTTKTVQDGYKGNCFMEAQHHKFYCDHSHGDTLFDIIPTVANGKLLLTHDDNPMFYACLEHSSSPYLTYTIHSMIPEDYSKWECEGVELQLEGETAACSVSDKTIATRSTAEKPTKPLEHRDMSPKDCIISPSAPSVAPSALKVFHVPEPSEVHTDGTKGLVSPDFYTELDFVMPSDIFPANTSHCAFQFRMPLCSSLPDGYPCSNVTGIVPENSTTSGMTAWPSAGVAEDNTASDILQVLPGQNYTLSVFECSPWGLSYEMKWVAMSIGTFALEFFQADVGSNPDSEFEEGVGAWIVPCQ
ncbi:hypothetical protein F4819DRAFT_485493 [Hypoxylon fuscum]|nr:hypothetical protein F4819DRAFT_485493 [Hypoxylon fuscum]